MSAEDQPQLASAAGARFGTTHWSTVLRAGGDDSPDARAALERLCATYWFPIYAHIRRLGPPPHDAQDLTQEFFARLIRLHSFDHVAPQKGRFRTFLLASLTHFLADTRDAQRAAKRGGGRPVISLDGLSAEQRYQCEPVTQETPEKIFDRRWLLSVMEQALEELRAEYAGGNRPGLFEHLREFLQNESADGDYERAAAKLHMTSGAVAVAVHRLRQRYRDLVRAEITKTVTTVEELEDEIHLLLGG